MGCYDAYWHAGESGINTCLWMEFKWLWITNDHKIF